MKKYILLLLIFSVSASAQLIDRVEYFIDSDNSIGAATQLTIAPEENLMEVLSTNIAASIAPGYHKLYFRVRDSFGRWSHTVRRHLHVLNELPGDDVVELEYFIDNDPSVGMANSVLVMPLGQNITQTFSVDIPDDVTPGYHKLYIRTKDVNGEWSQTTRKNIQVVDETIENIVAFEFFTTTDNGVSLCAQIAVDEPSPNGTWSFSLPLPDGTYFPIGAQNVFVRGLDSAGQWSHTGVFDSELSTPNHSRIISLYPNPTANLLHIEIPAAISGVQIFDINGRKCVVPTRNHNRTIDVSSLASGTYTIIVGTGSAAFTSKFIKL